MDPAYDLETLRGTVRLPAIRHETWHGMIFVNLDAGAGPLAPTLSRLEPEIGPYGVGRMKVADMVSLSGLPFNWKNMQENALEEYHTTYVHRGYHDNAPANRVVHGDFHSGDGGISRRVGLIIKGGEEVRGRPNFPLIPGLPDEQRGHFLFLAVPPALFLVVRPDGIKLFRILPQAADRMTLTISFLFPPGTIEQRDFPALMERQREFIQLLDQPDIESNTRVFRGLRSSYAPRGPYGPQERSLPQFNQWLLERYRSFLDAGGV
jgi:phenylpropionate dioxygenase-like ring-hydroxylating dioxygenase large terminal subunit